MNKWLYMLGFLLPASGCEQAVQDMYDQPRSEAMETSDFFTDGQSARLLPAGVIAYSSGPSADASGGWLGQDRAAEDPGQGEAIPVEADPGLLARGRERYDIYCTPCHGWAGEGNGIVIERGFPAPPSYHSKRLRKASDRHLFEVITHGYGAMTAYADRIAVHDRWAIVTYIRALQLSQHAQYETLPKDLRELLPEAER